jgi:hypothetical protein
LPTIRLLLCMNHSAIAIYKYKTKQVACWQQIL